MFTLFVSLMFLALVTISWLGHHSARIRYFNLAVFSIGWLVWLIAHARSRHSLEIPKFILPISILIGYLTLMVVNSPLPNSGLESALMAIFSLLSFFFFLDTLRGYCTVEIWEKALIASAIMYAIPEILSVLAWLQKWWTVSGSEWSWPPVGFRISGFFITSANVMAGYINLVLPFVVVRILREKQTSNKILWSLALIFFFIIEYFTSSRGGWVSALAGMSLTLIILQFGNIRKHLSLGSIKNLVLSRRITLGIVAFLVIGGLLGSIFIRQVQQTPGHTPGGSGRIRIWTNAFNVFLKSPVFGSGPASMGVLYAVERGVPPGFAPDHAHNGFLQIMGEFGFIGLVLVICAAGLIALCLLRSWENANEVNRPRIAAIAGAFLALSVHHLVDYLFGFYQYTIAVLLLLAILAYISPKKQKISIRRNLTIPILGIMLIGYLFGFLTILRGITPFQSGVSAADSGDWVRARDSICDAYDDNEENSYYAFQCSLTNAQVAFLFDDKTALDDALSAQYAGLEIDPYWPPHWANLAGLEWEIGERQQAIAHMEQAFAAASQNWIFALNLGWMEELSGVEEEALDYYKSALALNPWLETTHFFSLSDLRQQAVAEYEPFQNPSSSDDFALEGRRLLTAGKLPEAEAMLKESLNISPYNGEAYAWLAELQLIQNQSAQAWNTIQLAIFVENKSPIVYLVASEIADDAGENDQAVKYLLDAYQLFQKDNQSKRYYGGLYKRGLLPHDLVPQLVLPELNSYSLERFTGLLDHPEAFNDPNEAIEFSKWIYNEQEQ